jgi:hypothetical protein
MAGYEDSVKVPVEVGSSSDQDALEIARSKDQAALELVLRALELAHSDGKPIGTFIVVNLDTGQYVTSEKFMDANTEFMRRFPNAPGFAHCLGEPLYEPLGVFTSQSTF